jgi:subtilisin family serine protease
MAGGNSFATPHITGLIAKILAKHPDLTIFQMKAVLRALAANVSEERRTHPEPVEVSDD